MKRLLVVPALLCAVLVYAQGIQGYNSSGKLTPVRVDDAGHPQVDVLSGTLAATGADGGAVPTVPGPGPDGFKRITASTVKLTCPANGLLGFKLSTDACFECSVSGELAWVCDALNCATLGYQVNPGARYKTCFTQAATGAADGGPTSDYSCRSTSGTALLDCVPLR